MSSRGRSKSPKPTSVQEAQKLKEDRLAEYQRKREQRLKEKEKEEAEKERQRQERAQKEKERFDVRSRSPMPRPRSRSRSQTRRDSSEKDAERKAREEAAKKRVEEKLRAQEAKLAARKQSKEQAAIDKLQAEQAEALRLAEEMAAAAKKAEKELAKQKNKAPTPEEAKKQAEEKLQEQKIPKEDEQKAHKAADKAQQKAEDARLQKWKEQADKRKADAGVERVPKLSALLAVGGSEAEEYKKKQAEAKLATWKGSAGDKWEIIHQTFDGKSISEVTKDQKVTGISLQQAIDGFCNNPEKYLAMHYWPEQPDEFSYILREGTVAYEPLGVRTDGGGRLVIWQHIFHRLKQMEENVLPDGGKDKFTDAMTFEGKKLHDDKKKKHKPLLPGRGMGIGDEANMELIGPLPQPAHIRQGACVGDCWLLSAIACLADFHWAVERLFRKNTSPTIQDSPQDQPNQYTVTLWDLKTWEEVDVVVDERLPVRSDGSGYLLGAKPSRDGKFWVPYLEKAIAIHCGGYDKIVGGNCTDAWPMLTGSRNQFMIQKDPKTGKYCCGAKYNPNEQKWSDHSNSPHDCNPMNYRVEWPLVGGGGDLDLQLNEDELFKRVIAWDENNYLIGAATAGESDKQSTDGIVDNHAYSVIDSRQDICGTGIDLLLIRNPWGEGGELKNGQFMRSGPGWDKYPDVKKELNPAMEDNGLCWVTKEEFFRYFPTIYVCAFNMTRLKDSDYVNDLDDHFTRKPKTVPKKKKVYTVEEGKPIIIDKSSDPNSPYKIVEESFNGGVAYCDINKKVVHAKSIAEGVDEFRDNPEKYVSIQYQNNIVDEGWPIDQHHFTFYLRDGTDGLEVDAVPTGTGKKTMLTNVLREE